MDLLETVRFHGSFSFKYSDRPNTRSADFTDKVEEQVKGERLQRFQKRQDQISLQRNRDFIGQTVEVMVESLKPDSVQSRTGSNHIVHFTPAQVHRFTPGDIAMVTIVHAGKHSLNGDLAV